MAHGLEIQGAGALRSSRINIGSRTKTNYMQPLPNNLHSSRPFNTAGMKSYIAVHQKTNPPYIWNSFLPDENLLLFMKEGTMLLEHGDDRYTIQKNQLAFIRKGMWLRHTCQSSDSIWITFDITKDLVIDFTRQNGLSLLVKNDTGSIIVTGTDENWLLYIASLQPYIQETIIAGSFLRIKLMELLFCLAATNPLIMAQLLDVHESPRTDISRIVEENMLNSISLNQLARLAGRSVSSFRRDFLSIYNMPPSKWIRLKRLEKAQQLLTATNMSVTSICYELGFESIAHFSRIFKSRFGCAPSELRVNSSLKETTPPQLDCVPYGKSV